MNNQILITLSGRQGSGKTTFANIAIAKYGFTKIAIADRLKEVVAELYNIDLNVLLDPILKQQPLERPWLWNKEIALKFEQITGLSINFDISEQEFKLPREALQYIGTDVIRKIDPEFHIKECVKKVNNISNKKIIVDDLRYPNEKNELDKLGAISYHIIRPYYFTYSNHTSEISLNRSHIENIVLNKGQLKRFTNHVTEILQHQTNPRPKYNKEYLLYLLNKYSDDISHIAQILNINIATVHSWLRKYCINTHLGHKYKYNHDAFLIPNAQNAYMCGFLSGDGSIVPNAKKTVYSLTLGSIDESIIQKLHMLVCPSKKYDIILAHDNEQTSYHIQLSSPYIIDDLKFWNLIPRNLLKEKNKIPDILINNPDYMKYWISGLLDADGGIYSYRKKHIDLQILGSKSVIDYIISYINVSDYTSYPAVFGNNLFYLRYYNSAAKKVYHKLHNEYCLSRKWDKIKELCV